MALEISYCRRRRCYQNSLQYIKMFEPQTSIVDIFQRRNFFQARKLHEGRDPEVEEWEGGWVCVWVGWWCWGGGEEFRFT